jgi:hypothetical protein
MRPRRVVGIVGIASPKSIRSTLMELSSLMPQKRPT